MPEDSKKLVDNRILRVVLITIGFSSVALGVLGIFLPLLPTVPLLLLAAACFSRSSERFHNWLLEHPRFGPMIRQYFAGEGIPIRAKITAIGLIWLTIPASVFFFITIFWVQVVLIGIGVTVTVYLLRLPVSQEDEE